MHGLKVSKTSAQRAHEWLKEKGLLDSRVKPIKEEEFVVFPLKKLVSVSQLKKLFRGAEVVEERFQQRKTRSLSLKEALKELFSKEELESLINSFDCYGNIAVIEIPEKLKKKEKLIGETLLKTNKRIKTVAKIAGKHDTVFRIRPVEVIAGKKNLLADYKENRCRFRFELGKVFFSPRLSSERLRINRLIKKREVIGAFFAGVGPFPIVFAKNSEMKKAVAVELNPVAFRFLKENISLNRVEARVEAIKGDVKKVAKRFPAFFDRIVMPLPKGGESFLSEAIHCIKKNGVIHFYQFVSKENPFKNAIKSIKEKAAEQGKKARILRKARVRSFSPSVIQVVIDFKIV